MAPKDPIALEDRERQGARLFSPSANRNKDAISQVITQYIPQGSKVLEIASGSGEHGAHMCALRKDLTWQPSDPNAESRASHNDWAKDCGGHMLPSLDIDTSEEGWADKLSGFNALYCANMIHIAPWDAVLGLASGAGKLLKQGGVFILYGPFIEGDETAASNLEFDANLKRRNSSWGVRNLEDVKHIFSEAGFTLTARIVMPKENRIVIFTKSQ